MNNKKSRNAAVMIRHNHNSNISAVRRLSSLLTSIIPYWSIFSSRLIHTDQHRLRSNAFTKERFQLFWMCFVLSISHRCRWMLFRLSQRRKIPLLFAYSPFNTVKFGFYIERASCAHTFGVSWLSLAIFLCILFLLLFLLRCSLTSTKTCTYYMLVVL